MVKALPSTDGTVVALPMYVGCAQDRGHWPKYREAIRSTARHNTHLRLVLVEYTKEHLSLLATSLEAAIDDRSRRARAYVEQNVTDPLGRATSLAVLNCIDEKLRSGLLSTPEPTLQPSATECRVTLTVKTGDTGECSVAASVQATDSPPAASISPTQLSGAITEAVCAFTSTDDPRQAQIEGALDQQRKENEAINDEFRDQLRASVASGDISVEALAAMVRTTPHSSLHVVEESPVLFGKQGQITGLLNHAALNQCRGTVVGRCEDGRLIVDLASSVEGYPGIVNLQAARFKFDDNQTEVSSTNEAIADDDVDFVSLLERQQRSGSNSWRGSFKGMRRALQGTAQVATVCCLPSTKELAPTIVEAPYGPALCSETAHGARAAAEMYVRLSKHPGLPLSIDLEGRLGGAYGHIALLQAAVDAVDEQEDQLVYVFDTHKNTGLLEVDGVGSLRSLLEDPNIPKVLHCCYGDTSSLYHEYGIHVRNILDTGLADCMLQRFQTNKARGLAVVLKDWLGDVTLTHKGQITFEENIFLRRPIHPHLFVYAYEDVVFCGALYQRQVQELRKEGIHELACTLSQQRCPPDHLPKIHPAHRAPTRAVFCLVDPNSVICIREPDTGTLYLPSSPLLPAKASGPESTWKRRISAAWERVMGVPPKGGGVRQAIRAHMQKGFRVGDALVPQCRQCTPPCSETKKTKMRWCNRPPYLRQRTSHSGSALTIRQLSKRQLLTYHQNRVTSVAHHLH